MWNMENLALLNEGMNRFVSIVGVDAVRESATPKISVVGVGSSAEPLTLNSDCQLCGDGQQ
jgi:hypothetical protein